MKLIAVNTPAPTKDQRDLIIHALEREIDLERMGEEEIIEFAKEENGVDTDYIIKLQEIKKVLWKHAFS